MSNELTINPAELNTVLENKQFVFLYGAAYFSIQLTSVIEVYDSPDVKDLPWEEIGLRGMI